MEHTVSRTMMAERVPAGRLLRVGVLTAVFSAIANALVLAVASSLFGPVVRRPAHEIGPEEVKRDEVSRGVEEGGYRIALLKGTQTTVRDR